jgi:surface protein
MKKLVSYKDKILSYKDKIVYNDNDNDNNIKFISIWRVTSNETIYLPIYNGGNYNFVVNWGDGSVKVIKSYLNNSHKYSIAGDYTIKIIGTIEGWSFGNVGTSSLNLIEIKSWGGLKFVDAEGYFLNCSNLVLTGVTDTPNLDGVTNMITMFRYCSSLTTVNNMNSWNVSGVTNMFLMFDGATLFNQDISNWNVSNVFNFGGMFQNTNEFNQPIGNWDVLGALGMGNMFANSLFNQDISNWNVSSVNNMDGMFSNAISFNQDLSNWCVTNIPSPPFVFALGATSWVLPKPIWGSCP